MGWPGIQLDSESEVKFPRRCLMHEFQERLGSSRTFAMPDVHALPTRAFGAVLEHLLVDDHCGAFWTSCLVCRRWRDQVLGSPLLLRRTVEGLLGCGVAARPWGGRDWRACLSAVAETSLWAAASAPAGVVLGGSESPLRPYERCGPGVRSLRQRGRPCTAAHDTYDANLRAVGARRALRDLMGLVKEDQSCHATLIFEPLRRAAPWQRRFRWTVAVAVDADRCWHFKRRAGVRSAAAPRRSLPRAGSASSSGPRAASSTSTSSARARARLLVSVLGATRPPSQASGGCPRWRRSKPPARRARGLWRTLVLRRCSAGTRGPCRATGSTRCSPTSSKSVD